MHLCDSVAFAASPGLLFVVLTAVGYALAGIGCLPPGTAKPIGVFVFALLLLDAHEINFGRVMFLFLALPIPIRWPKL
jgi:hypothetical protein